MKVRLMPLLMSGMTIATIALPAIAQADPGSTTAFPALAEVQLSPSQQTELEALKEETVSQLESLLSLEQQTQLEDSLARGNGFKSAIESLDLSFGERRQIRNVMQGVRSEIDTILTPAQQQQLQQAR